MSDPLIDTTILLGVFDRLGVQKAALETAAESVAAAGAGDGLHYTRISGAGVYSVERDLITPAYNCDTYMSGQLVVQSQTKIAAFLTALSSHFQKAGYTTLGALLADQDPAILVSKNFAELWYWMRTESLAATYVFSESAITMGAITKASGTWSFAHDTAIGTGTGSWSDTNLAPQLANLYVNTKGASDALVTLTYLDENGDAQTSDELTVPASSSAATTVAVTKSAAPVLVLDVTAAAVTGGSDGDDIDCVSVPTRTPAL